MERELEQPEENERKWRKRIQLLAESHTEKLKSFQSDEDSWKRRLDALATDHRTKTKDLREVEQTWKKNIIFVAEEYAVKLESLRSQELTLKKEINRLQHWYDTRVATLQAKIDDMRGKFGLSTKAYDLKLKEFIDIQDKIKQVKKERAFRRANATAAVSNEVIGTTPNSSPAAIVDLADWQVPVATFDPDKSPGASYDVLEGQAEAEKQEQNRETQLRREQYKKKEAAWREAGLQTASGSSSESKAEPRKLLDDAPSVTQSEHLEQQTTEKLTSLMTSLLSTMTQDTVVLPDSLHGDPMTGKEFHHDNEDELTAEQLRVKIEKASSMARMKYTKILVQCKLCEAWIINTISQKLNQLGESDPTARIYRWNDSDMALKAQILRLVTWGENEIGELRRFVQLRAWIAEFEAERKRETDEQNDRVELRKLSEDEKVESRCESAPNGISLTSDDPLPDGLPLEDAASIKPAGDSSSEASDDLAISEELQDSSGPRNSHNKFALLTRNPARSRVDIRAGPGLRLPRPLARGFSRSRWTSDQNRLRTPVRKTTTEGSKSDSQCPLCIDSFDLSDQSFQPCLCGYRVCMFCVNRIRTMENGLCPACRAPYNDETIKSLSKAIGFDELKADQALEAHPETGEEKTPVRGNDQRQRRKTIGGRALTQVHCYRCKNLGHYARECWAKNGKCSSCGLRGHMSHECKTQHWGRGMS